MKENLLALGIFIGFFLIAFSGLIVPISLLNNYLIFGSILIVGLIVSLAYIFSNNDKIVDIAEYIFIPIRCTLSFGSIFVFTFLWANYYWRDQDVVAVKIPVKSFFLNEETLGSKFSSRTVIKSAFVIEYKGQTKNIVWHTRLEDSLMESVKSLEIKKRKGFFGIDIIEEKDLVYLE